MAKDDYFVLVYKILAYLYTVLKEGRYPDAKMLQYDSTLLADGLTVKATAVEAADSVWVVETILRGGAVKRIVIPCAHITGIEDIVYKDDEPLGYGVTLGATPDDSGVTHYEYIKGA